jgi:magnesium-transporting ATPase (P-type)
MLGSFGLFLWQLEQGVSTDYARTVAVNTLVLFEVFYLFNSRYLSESVLNRAGFLGNKQALLAIGVLILFQLCFTYADIMQTLFQTTSISLSSWILSVLVSSSVLWLVEIEKYVFRYKT